MDLAAGSRWQSAVDTTEVVVVRPPTAEVVLECGGHPMVPHGTPAPAGTERMEPSDAHWSGTQLGKRYVDDEAGIEVLCTKAGEASLSVSGRSLTLKTAKPLPSSD